MNKTTCVLDTNVIISGVLFSGNPKKVLKLGIDDKIHIYLSPQILLETSSVLHKKFQLTLNEIELIIKGLSEISTITIPQTEIDIIKSDPSDNIILECAVEVSANYIVSGDKHLLDLKKYKDIEIVTPAIFIKIVNTENNQSSN